MNGHPNGAGGGHGPAGARPPTGPFPPIADISANASERVASLRQAPIGRVLESAKHHFTEAKVMVSNRAPLPGAYWAYLVAYELVVEEIPRHRDFHDKINMNRGQMHRDFTQLLKDVRSMEERFKSIKDIIANDNKRNGAHVPSRKPYPVDSSPSPHNVNSSLRRDDELMLPSVPTALPLDRISANSHDPSRSKPVVQPKPQSLHGKAVHQHSQSFNGGNDMDGSNGIDLADRFAKLRGIPKSQIDTASARSSQDFSVKMPSPSDFHASGRPLGPREMPHGHSPSLPILPLNTQFAASLPKEPSPIYSPARNLSLPASINPPRSTARSMVGTGGRNNSLAASSASSHTPNGNYDGYFPAPPIQEQSMIRRESINKPIETQITAEKLYDYIRLYNVLLIDVRDRAEFDAGHIYVRSIICVEPASLQDGISAEQLQDRLVISPDEELALYERRHEFDVVIYYDYSTKTNKFLDKYNPNEYELALKRVYTILHEFNEEKPLKRPPIFLMGGILAWQDLVGPQSLKTSQTLSLAVSGQPRSHASRRPLSAGYGQRTLLQNRRKREYLAIDPEEQNRWLEEVRRGRSVVEHRPEEDGDDEASPVYRTAEDFLRRYPDVEDQQSMMFPPSRPQRESRQHSPARIPAAPSRPPPAVPRVSYSGVHERELARQSSGNQPPAYISPGRPGSLRLHRTGLINFGVTCYMNSIVQCLSANPTLTSIFLSRRYIQDLQRENWKGTKGILSEAYETLLSNLYKGDTSAIRPSTFRRVCGLFNRQWAIDQQQDAKEFLEFVLDSLHEDLNATWSKAPLRALEPADEEAREKLPRQVAAKIEWNRYQHRDMSLIGNLFAGQHASMLTCTTCGVTSTTYEAFWSISVEIPHDRPCDVRDCLRSYCSTERLGLEDSWRCPRCKTNREAMKKITITRAPDTLVIHFKRFSASHSQNARKIHTPIYFPLQGLDMGPYMEKAITPEQEEQVMQSSRGHLAQLASLRQDPAMNGPFMYNAYGVVRHHGTNIGSGHYTAVVKDRSKGCWRDFNDDRIRDFEPANLPESERLQNEKAYVVFYERERVAGGI